MSQGLFGGLFRNSLLLLEKWQWEKGMKESQETWTPCTAANDDW